MLKVRNHSVLPAVFAALVGTAIFSGPSARADVIAQYPFALPSPLLGTATWDDNLALYVVYPVTSPSPLLGSSDTDPHSNASLLLSGPGGMGILSPYPSDPTSGAYLTLLPASEAGAVTAESYFHFSVTPDAGYRLNLSSLTFDTNTGPSNSLQTTFFVRSSLDGYAANLASFTQQASASVPRTIDLNGPTFQEITDPVDFRLYLYDNGSDPLLQAARIENVTLNGAAGVVAEPGSLALFSSAGLSCLGLVARRRRLI